MSITMYLAAPGLFRKLAASVAAVGFVACSDSSTSRRPAEGARLIEFHLAVAAESLHELSVDERQLLGCGKCIVLGTRDGAFVASPSPELSLQVTEVYEAVIYAGMSPIPPGEELFGLFLRVRPEAYLRFADFAQKHHSGFTVATQGDFVIGYSSTRSWLSAKDHIACGSFGSLQDAATAAARLGLKWRLMRYGEEV